MSDLSDFIHSILYDKMTIDDYYTVMDDLGVQCRGGRFRTMCHHVRGDEKNAGYNLQFDSNRRSFFCHSQCGCCWDLLGVAGKIRTINGEDGRCIPTLIYICNTCGIPCDLKVINEKPSDVYNWNYLKKYTDSNYSEEINNTIYNIHDIDFLDKCVYKGWEEEGISKETQKKFDIRWYDRLNQIVIPVRDEDGNFIGTHCRNLNPRLVEDGFKYDHLRLLDGREYKFAMSNVLFGLNFNKPNIERTKTVTIFESPKSVMQMDDIMGKDNNSVAIFGTNFQNQKLKLLLDLGVEDFYIALDRQYHICYETSTTEEQTEWEKYKNKVDKIINTIGKHGKCHIVYDREYLLDFKDSPSDKGKKTWLTLVENCDII